MPALFFHKFWHIIGDGVTYTILSLLNDKLDPSFLNKTYIAFIPKIKNPKTIKDYQPISLCNIIFKIVTKTIANRLKNVLSDIIHNTQNAFIVRKLIIDNALLAFKAFHFINKKRNSNKFDMSKVYDRVEWSFLKGMMNKMRFPEP